MLIRPLLHRILFQLSLSHLADVDTGLVLVVGPVADGEAQLVLDVGSV